MCLAALRLLCILTLLSCSVTSSFLEWAACLALRVMGFVLLAALLPLPVFWVLSCDCILLESSCGLYEVGEGNRHLSAIEDIFHLWLSCLALSEKCPSFVPV